MDATVTLASSAGDLALLRLVLGVGERTTVVQLSEPRELVGQIILDGLLRLDLGEVAIC